MKHSLKTGFLSLFTCTVACIMPNMLSAEEASELSIIEKFRSDEYITLGRVLGTLSKLDLKPIHKGDDIFLKGRELKFIEKAGDQNVCNGSNGSWVEAINFDIGDNPYQLNVLASAACHHVDLKPLFIGSSISTPELFYDVAYPSVHDQMFTAQFLQQKFKNRDDFLKNVTFEIKKIQETPRGVIEEWTVHHKSQQFTVKVKFSPIESGKYSFSLI